MPSPTRHEKEWRDALEAAKRRWVFQTPEEQMQLADKLTYWDDWRAVRALPRVPEEGCTINIVGEKQVYKTGVLLHDCLTAVRQKNATVLYLAAEGAHGIKTRRLPTYCNEHGVKIGDLSRKWVTFATSPNLLDEQDVETFIAVCKEQSFRPDIVVIDTLTRASGDQDICAPQVGAQIIMSMEKMARAFGGATVIGVTHPPKRDGKGRAIGSAMKDGPAGPEQVVSFRVKGGKEEKLPPVVVEVGSRNVAEPVQASPMDRAIAALATFGPVGAKATEWERRSAERDGPKSGSFYTQKDKAVAAGRVEERDGRFFVAANDNPAPADTPPECGVN